MIKVYFMKSFGILADYGMIGYSRDRELVQKTLLALEANAYQYVATVNCDDLEEAWVQTNSIFAPWYENETIEEFNGMPEFEGHARSAMVNDIFIKEGKAYIVAAFGFTQIGDDNFSNAVAKTLENLNV